MATDGPARTAATIDTTREERACLDALEQLWPGSQVVARGASGRRGAAGDHARVSRWLLLRGRGGERLLLPDSPVLAPAALDGFTTVGVLQQARALVRRRLLAHGLRRPAAARAMLTQPPRTASIETHLGSVLGRPVRVAMRLRPGRAQGGLVLQVLDADGRTLAFAKVGVTVRARELMRAEVRALESLELARLRHVTVPRLLYDGDWRGLDVVVQTPLLARGWRRPEPALVTAAMREISTSSPASREPLAGSAYLQGLQHRLGELGPSDENALLHRALGALVRQGAEESWRFGPWHGDWSASTARAQAGRLQIWGWERYDASVPLGFDAAHASLRAGLSASSRSPYAAQRLLVDAERVLRPWAMTPARARAVVILYLIESAARQLHDEQGGMDGDTPPLHSWLLPALTRETQRLLAAQGRGRAR
jgi:hypothetical protein